jgi:hypothetical protein
MKAAGTCFFLMAISVVATIALFRSPLGTEFLTRHDILSPVVTKVEDHPGIIRAERIQIVDHRGTVRAVLGTAADGSTGLTVYSSNGEPAARLVVTENGEPIMEPSVADYAGANEGEEDEMDCEGLYEIPEGSDQPQLKRRSDRFRDGDRGGLDLEY